MKRLIIGTIGLALLTVFLTVLGGAASAQQNPDDEPMKMEQKRKQKEAEEIDKRYQSTLQKTRGSSPAAPVDPWSNMRGDDSKTKR